MNLKNTFITILLSIGFLTGNAQIMQTNFSVGSGTTQIELIATINSGTNTVDFEMTGPDSKWFAIGFSASSMSAGSYGIIANVNGGNPQEYNIQGQMTPNLQSSQDLSNFSSSTNAGRKTFTFNRALNTSDPNDYIFPTTAITINVIWAYGNGTTLVQHQNRGVSSMSFSNPCNIPITNLPEISICSGDSAMIFGAYYSQSGIFLDTLQTSIGCDSVLSQELIVGNTIVNSLPDSTICFGDTIQLFGQNVFQSGIYSDTLNSSTSACDSVVVIDVTVNPQIDTTVINAGSVLTANQFAQSYQWYDCTTDTSISGANNISYTPTQSGSYKVEIFVGNWSAISSCHEVLVDGVNEFSKSNLKISPNPASDFIILNNIEQNSDYQVEIYNTKSQLILSENINSNSNKINIEKLQSGVYIIVLKNNNKLEVYNSKLIKL
jgi:hypothetical protein